MKPWLYRAHLCETLVTQGSSVATQGAHLCETLTTQGSPVLGETLAMQGSYRWYNSFLISILGFSDHYTTGLDIHATLTKEIVLCCDSAFQ